MILIFGDVHSNFKHVLPTVQKQKPSAIIFLGDMDLSRPFHEEIKEVMSLTDVRWILGNHDTDTQENYDYLFKSDLSDRNLHGRVVEIDGLKVAGLGGVFREKIWYPQFSVEPKPQFKNYNEAINQLKRAEKFKAFRSKEEPSPKLTGQALTHKSSIFYDDWLNLYSQKADILVTHEAPSCHPYGFLAIDNLAKEMCVKRTFHGHHHDCLDYSQHFEKLGFEAFGVDLCGVSDINGKSILGGQKDKMSMKRNQP